MNYRELSPPPDLAFMIECIWTLEGTARELAGDIQPVLPDGRPELILHFGDAFERISESGKIVRQPAVIYAGQLTSQLNLRPIGCVAVLGVRFRPDGAASIIRMPQRELAGLTIGVDEVSREFARELAEMLDSRMTLFDAARTVQAILLRHTLERRVDAQVRHVVESIQRRRGCVSIERLSSEAGLSRRQLERRFGEIVGVSPKRLARIARFQHALGVLQHVEGASRGTTTAAECGFADQAHFIRDFRELAGCAPGEHLLRSAELTGFFLERRPNRSSSPRAM